MLTPEQLQRAPLGMVDLYATVELDILRSIATRINAFDMYTPAAQYQVAVLEEMGALHSDIMAVLSGMTRKSQKELAAIMGESVGASMAADNAVYRAAGITTGPAAASAEVRAILSAGMKATNGSFANLTRTAARAATNQFARELDRAYLQISSGAITPDTAIRNAVKRLAAQGVSAVEYPSGRTDALDVAVRRSTVTGVNQTVLKIQDQQADELGVDLVEVTAHAGARPEHTEWQGGIYSRSGASKKYKDFRASTGYGTGEGLGGWNCSHSYKPHIEGMPRTYSAGQLNGYEAKNITYNGEKLTEYEALQKQREIERHIRQYRREKEALRKIGQDLSESNAKISQWSRTQNDFIDQTGLRRQPSREAI